MGMLCVVQRARSARVVVDDRSVGAIDHPAGGLVVLCGLLEDDAEADLRWMAEKLVNLRIFADEQGKMNRSLLETGGALLLVPNFTLAGEASRGRRPSFDRAMKPERSEGEFARFVEMCRGHTRRVETGVFRAHMLVELVNDGPITIVLDSRSRPQA